MQWRHQLQQFSEERRHLQGRHFRWRNMWRMVLRPAQAKERKINQVLQKSLYFERKNSFPLNFF